MEIGLRTDDHFAEVFHRGVGLLLLVKEHERTTDRDEGFSEEMLCKAIKALGEAKEMKPTDPKSAPPKPMPTIDGKVGAGGPGPLDYFVPIGTANAPPRKSPTITSTAPATLPQFPAPLGTAIQPAASGPAASPLGALPTIPTLPESRYPGGNR
jgi:hypothetical protein